MHSVDFIVIAISNYNLLHFAIQVYIWGFDFILFTRVFITTDGEMIFQIIVTRNNIVWKLAHGYCLCYCKTFSLVPDSTECTKKIFTEECSTLFVPLKIK